MFLFISRFVFQQSLDLMFFLSMIGVRFVSDSGQGECVCMRLCIRGCARVCTCKCIFWEEGVLGFQGEFLVVEDQCFMVVGGVSRQQEFGVMRREQRGGFGYTVERVVYFVVEVGEVVCRLRVDRLVDLLLLVEDEGEYELQFYVFVGVFRVFIYLFRVFCLGIELVVRGR